MTNIQVAIGVAQIERIDKMLEIRSHHESIYAKLFEEKGIKLEMQKNIPGRKKLFGWLVLLQMI